MAQRKQMEAWGGEVHLPRWLRRRRKPDPGDTPERLAEHEKPEPDRSVLENVDKAMMGQGIGGWHDLPR